MMVQLLTPDEAATILKMSRRTVYRLIAQREIPATRIGRGYRIDSRELDERVHQGSRS